MAAPSCGGESVMRCWRTLLLAPLLGLASLQAFACYTVYDSSNRVVYQSEKAPVDMSRPLHETLPARFPGASMVFDDSRECTVISSVALGNGGQTVRTASPLLTDERTARALNLPHRSLGNGIAVVAPQEAAMGPGVTVVPRAAVASKSGGRETVITEWRNPPVTTVTTVQRGESVAVTELR
jgi:hypothetical protein